MTIGRLALLARFGTGMNTTLPNEHASCVGVVTTTVYDTSGPIGTIHQAQVIDVQR